MSEHRRPGRRMGGPGAIGHVEKAKDFKGSIGKLAAYVGKNKVGLIFVVIFAAVSTVFSVAGPKVLGKATTALAEGLTNKISGIGGIDFTYISKILLFVLELHH